MRPGPPAPHGGFSGGIALDRSTLKLVARGRSLLGRGARFLAANPVLAKALPTATGYAFGDVLTQHFGPLWPHGGQEGWPTKGDIAALDPSKTALMAGVGGFLAAPLSLALCRGMDVVAPGSGPLLAGAKFTIDQVVGCAAWQAAYFSISEPYRATFLAWRAAQRQQQLEQQQQLEHRQQQQQQQQQQAAAAAAC